MKLFKELSYSIDELEKGQKVYFASDFHLGVPDSKGSKAREQKIIKWLEHVSHDASAIFLLGDLFDFWFEYKTTVPKGFNRFLGKLAAIRDQGIPIFIFAGNHDLWYRDYFPNEFDIPIIHHPAKFVCNKKTFLLGHGDGLAEGKLIYKGIKKVFTNPICQWFYRWLHPDVGIAVARFWSSLSRKMDGHTDPFLEKKEPLFQFCASVEKKDHHDFYVLGHRHLPMELAISDKSTYFNLGEWITQCNYLEFDGTRAQLKIFDQ